MNLILIGHVLFILIKTTRQFCFLSFCFDSSNKRFMMGVVGELVYVVAELIPEFHLLPSRRHVMGTDHK